MVTIHSSWHRVNGKEIRDKVSQIGFDNTVGKLGNQWFETMCYGMSDQIAELKIHKDRKEEKFATRMFLTKDILVTWFDELRCFQIF